MVVSPRCPAACLALALLLSGWLQPAVSQTADSAAQAETENAAVNAATVNARLKEVEASTDLDETTKGALTTLLTKTLGYLEAVRSNDAATEAYQQALQTAPQQAEQLRARLEQARAEQAAPAIRSTEATPFGDIEQELLQEKANLAAVKAKLADIEDQIARLSERPNAVRKRLSEIKSQRAELETALKMPAPGGELPWLSEVRRWSQQAQIAALRSESRMLDQELLSQPARKKLLEARRDNELRSIERIGSRVKLLEDLANRQGRAEAEKAEAIAADYDATGKHPLIQRLAAQNAELTSRIKTMVSELRKVSAMDDEVVADAKRIENSYRLAREKLEIAGMTEVLAELLRKQRATLPELRKLKKLAAGVEQESARLALQQIQHSEDYKHLRDIGEYVDELVAELPADEAAAVRDDLEQLAGIRKTLLEKAIALEGPYLRALDELDNAYRLQFDNAQVFDEFLSKNLLWIRSAPWPTLRDLRVMPDQLARLFSPAKWLEVSGILFKRAVYSPPFLLMLVVFALLLWKTRRMRALLKLTGSQVGKPSIDRISYTLKAIVLTLLLAAPWPMLLYAIGWELGYSTQATDFSHVVSYSLLWVAPAFFYIQFFSVMCAPGGVADRHFQWPDPIPQQLRREFRFLKVIFLPVAFFTLLVIYSSRGVLGIGLERLAQIVALGLLAIFFYRVSGVALKHLSSSAPRVRQLYMLLTVLAPLLLAVLTFIGYFYTASMLSGRLIATLWFVFGLVVLHQFAVRWLLLAQRRIFLNTVRNRMQAAAREAQSESVEIEGISLEVQEPEIDLMALREESRKLLNSMLVIIGVVGFWIIWADLLPAFGILDEITVWHHAVIEAGEEKIAPVTLADIGKALLIAVATLIAVRRLPSLLEIVLLQRFNMTSGSRYTATALTTYAIVAIGAFLFFRLIGADWSKLQWLFAALGVGIGFGLQEIVANFISGLIILFERPIRVGDVVTVGDTDGVVTRIRIRATTIRNWENQELLVPNKEFITGRLLNWSLSDQTTRVKVPVGVAYGSDVQKAMQLMDQAARENDKVLADPAPSVIFEAFGDNTLNLVLRCFVDNQSDRLPTITELHEAINTSFNEAGITIAFPQRDVHLDTTRPLDVRIRPADDAGSAAG